MNVNKIDCIQFKYNHPLKKAFDKGLLPKGFKGIYEVE